ncbi:MAG: hypothetical protein IJW49_12110 [Clostridia bacterium]|nr:hypothetical protein [Clostridia bacterium]MBQ9807232.1 hypothetical protein [Clostridia bacterium]
MKRFFADHSYDMVKMLLNQIAIAIFGFSLVLTAGKMGSVGLRNVTSVFSILFYLFLIYITAWDIGYKDKISVDVGKKKYQPWKGVLISLCANSINFIFAIGIMLVRLGVSALSTFGAICQFCAGLLEGMYTGILMNTVGGVMLNNYWFFYFLIPLPAVLVSGLAYVFGLKDVKFTSFFNRQEYPESDRAPKQKKDDRHED